MSVYSAVVLGGAKSGKTSLCLRLVAHRYDPFYRATEADCPFFVRSICGNADCLVMLEDTPALERVGSQTLLKTPWWFERWPDEGDESDEEESNNAVRKKKVQTSTHHGNPMFERQKRFGAIVVFDVSSTESFAQAEDLLKDIFARALGFNPQGWKQSPVVVILVGTKSDIVGTQRVVTQEMVDKLVDKWSNEKIVDRQTKQPRRHITYLETSAKQGTNCDQILPLFLSKIRSLPTKSTVYAPDSMRGWYGQLLESYEWAREFHGWKQDVGETTERVSRQTSKVLGPVFKMKWLKESFKPITNTAADQFRGVTGSRTGEGEAVADADSDSDMSD